MRGVPGNDHLRPGIDVDRLAVNAPGHVGAMAIVAYPPLIAVGPAWQCQVAGGGEFLRIAAVRNIIDNTLRHDPATVEVTAPAHDLTKSGKIAKRGVEAAASTLDPEAINGVVRVLLRTHRLPDPGRKLC